MMDPSDLLLQGGTIWVPLRTLWQILLLSGIGPRAEIVKHGIECVHHLPGVGQNLQGYRVPVFSLKLKMWFIQTICKSKWRNIAKSRRHCGICLSKSSNTIGIGSGIRRIPLLAQDPCWREDSRRLLRKRNIPTCNITFARSKSLTTDEFQHFSAGSEIYNGLSKSRIFFFFRLNVFEITDLESAHILQPCLLRSAEIDGIFDAEIVQSLWSSINWYGSQRFFISYWRENLQYGHLIYLHPNYFAVEEDVQDYIKAVKQTRDLMGRNALAEYNGGEKFPGPAWVTHFLKKYFIITQDIL